VFGGIGTIYGPIVAAFFLIFVSELMFNFGPWRYIISSALIIVVVVLFPGGMMALIERFSTWIASYFRGNSRTSGSADIPASPGRS
jgi:ABC-type branched-subunit amino acid transport system permease subunit